MPASNVQSALFEVKYTLYAIKHTQAHAVAYLGFQKGGGGNPQPLPLIADDSISEIRE